MVRAFCVLFTAQSNTHQAKMIYLIYHLAEMPVMAFPPNADLNIYEPGKCSPFPLSICLPGNVGWLNPGYFAKRAAI